MTSTRVHTPSRQEAPGALRSDTTRVVAVVVAAVAQVVGSPLGSALSGRSVGDVSDGARSLVTPAGYAFSIWGLIFLGSLAWAVYQALPAQRSRLVHRATGWPLAAAFAGNAVWETVYPFGGAWQYVTQVLIFGITAAAAVGFARLQRDDVRGDLRGWARALPAATAGLLLGWVTVAPVAQVGNTGVALGADPATTSSEVWAVVAMVAVAVVGAFVVLSSRVAAGPFAAAVVWGLVAIAVAGGPLPVTVAALGAAAVVLVSLVVRASSSRTSTGSVLLG
ncbi:TspO and MBR related proteins [Klenkia soli]|uniref:TspO and MBR related proteins n=1 Tax=Klenkia soli TaxID=1052260 RepID=A0A1H0PIE1_9ACTN|nr:tryptophan-rich sensory protein [Klenkia soli]SDP04862.1 TspO and MBR related proteins [Klenkia soli]